MPVCNMRIVICYTYLVLLAGCPAGDDDTADDDTADDDTADDAAVDDDTGDDDAGDDDAGDDDAGDDDSGGMSEDEALLRQAIDGLVDPDEALETVAARGGLPVETTSGDYLFACTCGPVSWSLAGDHEGWSGQPMTASGALWWIEVAVPEPDGSKYKFTDGAAWIPDPRGRRFDHDEFGEISLVRASAPHLERWYRVEGFGLQPRDVQVWVPAAGSYTHLLLVHDGQNLYDPDAIWGGWRLQESLPAAMLAAGVDNTPARMDEYTHVEDYLHDTWYGGEGDAHADLVELVVRPLIEDAYGTPQAVAVMGSSLGGLASFHTAGRHEGRYDMAISLSGTMGWGSIGADNETMIERYEAAGHRDTALYLDSGGNGTCVDADGDGIWDDDPAATDNYCENQQFRDVLEAAGYVSGTDLWHWWEPDAPHNEAAWADRVWRPLEIFAAM